MTTYYIAPASLGGIDTNNGLGPDASHATNKPWATLAKALASGSVVVPGDTVWLSPGIFYEGAGIIVIAGVTSGASHTAIRGDPTNVQGFKNASGVRTPAGIVWASPRTSGDGLDGPMTSTADFLNLQNNAVKGLEIYDMVLEANALSANVFVITVTAAGSSDLLVQNCRCIGVSLMTLANGIPAASRNITFRRCTIITAGALVAAITNAPATADVDLTILFESCLYFGRCSTSLALAPSGGNLAGGVRWKGCTVVALANATATTWASTALRVSTVVPCTIEGCTVIGGVAVTAGTAGHFIDNGYNRFFSWGASTNYTPAGTSVEGAMLNLVLPDLVRWGLELPRFDVFGWTAAAAAAQRQSGWANTTADFRGRTVRPWGAGPSIGYLEAGAVSQDTGSQITGGGANSVKVTGAGEFSLFLPVDPVATTLTIKTASTSYGGASYPQMIMEAQPDLGLTQTTATATDATEQVLTIGPFTPTAAGIVELRFISRSSSVSSATYFDLLAG